MNMITVLTILCFRELEQIDGIQQNILALFGAQSEEVKFAAAFALGNISVGDINKHLPIILSQIKEQPKKRYLLLNSLKEVYTLYHVLMILLTKLVGHYTFE